MLADQPAPAPLAQPNIGDRGYVRYQQPKGPMSKTNDKSDFLALAASLKGMDGKERAKAISDNADGIEDQQRLRTVKTLERLIDNRDWEKLLRLLQSQSGWVKPAYLSTYGDDMNGMNMLHAACRLQPPMNVINDMLHKNPSLASQTDGEGRYPLHLASFHGCFSSVVDYIAKCYPKALLSHDSKGNLPLHLACKPERFSPTLAQEDRLIKPGSAVINVLCSAAPRAVNIEDDQGRNAIEIAIELGLAKKVCRLLMKASEKDWKDRERKLERTPSHIAASLTSRASPLGKETKRLAAIEKEQLRDNIEKGASFKHIRSSVPTYADMILFWQERNKTRKDKKPIDPSPSTKRYSVAPSCA